MKVKCIEKPREGFIKTNVTVGKIYSVKKHDSSDYYLTDDTDEEWYYQTRFFEQA